MMSPAAAVIGIERISLRRCFQRNDNLLSNTMFSTKVTLLKIPPPPSLIFLTVFFTQGGVSELMCIYVTDKRANEVSRH